MRSSWQGGSAGEVAALKGFAERLGAELKIRGGLPEEEPLPVTQCPPRGLGPVESTEWVTRRFDEDPPGKGTPDAQSPLPGLETPPCR